jgi:hypothetical protein
VLDDLANAPDLSGRAVGAREDDTEAQVILQLSLASCHHGRSWLNSLCADEGE